MSSPDSLTEARSHGYADAVRIVQRGQTVELVRDAAGVSPRGVGKD